MGANRTGEHAIRRERAVILLILRGYRILKERLLAFHGNESYVGMEFDDPPIDFAGLAESMGMPAQRIVEPAEVAPALQSAFRDGGPRLLDVSVADGFGR